MRIGLFVPCYVDQLRPSVGVASLELLESRGLEVEFPAAQTCCGQPFSSSGALREARRLAQRFLRIFGDYDHVVCPSASCVAMVRGRYPELLPGAAGLPALASRTHELCEFLVQGPGVPRIGGRFPHRVGVQSSCHALRELRGGASSERMLPPGRDPARELLACLDGIEFAEPGRPDECCGFGGSFSVEEGAVSSLMGMDRLEAHRRAGAEVIVSTDLSCLLHLEGLARRAGLPVRMLHVAEVLSAASRT